MNRSAVATFAAACVALTLACSGDADRAPSAPNCNDPSCSVAPGGGAAGGTVGMGGSEGGGGGSAGTGSGGAPQPNGGAAPGPGSSGGSDDGSGTGTTPVDPGGADAGTTPTTPGGSGGGGGDAGRSSTGDIVFVPIPT
jgi:hypothetical protein